MTTEFRQYQEDDHVARFYRANHEGQTLAFARQKAAQFGRLDAGKLGVWQACEKLNELVDDSDPDTSLSQIEHLLQTAEAARRDGRPNWFVLTCLIHDLGKLLCLVGEPQWAVVGDTFPLGCRFSTDNIYPHFFAENPDVQVRQYQSEPGIYERGCGLFNVTMSWGHDEYMYQVAKNYLPIEALYMIRFHSFYALHNKQAYEYLLDDRDRQMLPWVKSFNQYDLYSKAESPPDVAALKPFYQQLIGEYFPEQIAW